MREIIWAFCWLTRTFYSLGWAFCSQLNLRTLSPFLRYEILEKLVTFIVTMHHTLFEIHKSFTVIIWFENIFLNLFKITLFFWPSTILIKHTVFYRIVSFKVVMLTHLRRFITFKFQIEGQMLKEPPLKSLV